MQKLNKALQFAEWGFACFLTLITGLRFVDPKGYQDPIKANLVFLQSKLFLAVLVCALAILLLKCLNEFIVSKYTVRAETVKFVVDSLHKKYFENVPEEHKYEHRVTVFKARKKWFPFTDCHLRIYSRSGTTYQKSKTRLIIDDDHLELNEGIAGWAWFINATATKMDLPAWPNTDSSNSISGEKALCEQYAKEGRIPLSKASSLNVKSRSVTATVVRTSKGKKWGVLVLDSRDPKGISELQEKKALVELSADLMTRMV